MKKERDSFNPPKSVRDSAKKGLELRKKFGRGGLSSRVAGKLGIGSGIVRDSTITQGKNLSLKTVKRMKNYFSRHRKDKRPGWNNPKNPSNGYIAWLLWGGDAGKNWAEKTLKRIQKFKGEK